MILWDKVVYGKNAGDEAIEQYTKYQEYKQVDNVLNHIGLIDYINKKHFKNDDVFSTYLFHMKENGMDCWVLAILIQDDDIDVMLVLNSDTFTDDYLTPDEQDIVDNIWTLGENGIYQWNEDHDMMIECLLMYEYHKAKAEHFRNLL